MKGCFSERLFVVFTLGDGFPLPFIFYLPTLMWMNNNVSSLSQTHAHTHLLTLTLSLLYAHIRYKGLHTCTHNTNCSHLTVIWTDMFTLLLIWMSLHCLASFAILKTPLLSLSKLQADGGESAWLSLRSCESCFFFSQFILETILHTPLSAQKGCLSSTVWHIFVRVQDFLLLHTIFLHSLRGGIFVWICTLKHIINNPVCSKWMTCPSVAVISWKATSLKGWNSSKLMKY